MHCYSGNRRRTHGMVLRLSALLVLALSIDAQDDQGGVGSCGPVYVSFVMVGRVDMVSYLLAHRADCERVNHAGLSAYKSARRHNVNPQVTKPVVAE